MDIKRQKAPLAKQEEAIHDNMTSSSIVKNMGKGAWILGKRAFQFGLESAKNKIVEYQETKEMLSDKSDEELLDMIKHKKQGVTAAYSILKERDYSSDEVKQTINA